MVEQSVQALIQRARGLDSAALVRHRPVDQQWADVFVTTPFQVLGSRRYQRTHGDPEQQQLGWPGALPPVTGFTLLDEVPAHVVRDLAAKGKTLARQFAGPMGPPSSLLEQPVLTVEDTPIPMRMIFAASALGFIPQATRPDLPQTLRVSAAPSWVRIDAPFGSIYHSTTSLRLINM